MLDLNTLDVKKASNHGAECELTHPTEGTVLRLPTMNADDVKPGEEVELGEALSITVAGTDSDVYRDALKSRARQRLAAQKKNRNKEQSIDLDEQERKSIELLAKCTLGWQHITDGGVSVPFSVNNAITIYTKYPWIREQVDLFMADRSNFLKG